MKILNKQEDKDFIVLNITDPQLRTSEWDENNNCKKILEYTVDSLIQKIKPDLITVSGDISWGKGEFDAYKNFADLIDSYNIPWAPVWGNHDNGGNEVIEEIEKLYLTYPNCIYEKGDPALGNGNYIIAVKQGDKTVEGIFMMDTHSSNNITLLDRFCEPQVFKSYASLTSEQLVWYSKEVENLKKENCMDSTLIIHIPLYGYREAFLAATEDEYRAPKKISLNDSYNGIGWKNEYKDKCFGVNREGIASSNYDDGVLDVLSEYGHTKHVIAGHEHVNNFSIPYKGIRLTYATKTGKGCYWDPDLNGGTVLTITKNGVSNLRHEYVDVSHLIEADDSI